MGFWIMEWYVCKYEASGNMVILPDFYVNELCFYHKEEISIMKSFKSSVDALDYLVGISLAEHLINKTLE